MKHCLLIVTLMVSSTVAAQSQQPPHTATRQSTTEQPSQKLKVSPSMRVVDRDWQYFSQLSCQQLGRIVAHSDVEQLLLAKRQRECVKRYKAFLPQPVDR